jgi:hypothetical protein
VPERNRVTPLGEIVAIPLRGAWTGNRGVIHRGREILRAYRLEWWITCALEFRGRWREQWLPNRWTHLYFHDEAVSFAAGHRPCAQCRWADYEAYRDAWADGLGVGVPKAPEMDRLLHGERLVGDTDRRRLHEAPWTGLPDGAFVLVDDAPALVLSDRLVGWTSEGYGDGRARPRRGTATVITPPASVAVMRAGYPPQIDAGAGV